MKRYDQERLHSAGWEVSSVCRLNWVARLVATSIVHLFHSPTSLAHTHWSEELYLLFTQCPWAYLQLTLCCHIFHYFLNQYRKWFFKYFWALSKCLSTATGWHPPGSEVMFQLTSVIALWSCCNYRIISKKQQPFYHNVLEAREMEAAIVKFLVAVL